MLHESNLATDEHAFDLPRLCRYFSELSPQPMLAVEGPDFVVRHVNAAFARLAGQDLAELIGRPFAEAVPEEKANECLSLLERVYRTGRAECLVEQQHSQTPPGYWSYVAWAILGADERPVGVMVQVTEATEIAMFREQVTAMNQSLLLSSVKQHELTEAAEQLNAALKEQTAALADAYRRKDEFLAMVSHELRNPLSPILNAVYLLRLQGGENPLQREALGMIERQAVHLARIVDDLLEISRIATGRIHLRPSRIELNSIVNRATASARPLIEARKHRFSVSLWEQPIWLNADPVRLEQVVVNLLNNAAKYTGEGGQIWLTVLLLEGEVEIRVKDTGVGIEPGLLPRIFDLFTQAEKSLHRSHGGLGIGLALVRSLVEMHGGSVTAESAGLGRGSELTVRLPVVDLPIEASDQPPPSVGEQAPPGSRVLVVDDNRDTADSIMTLLQMAGYETRAAYTGAGGLEMALSYQPRVALLDIGLPEMDGFELARLVRQDPRLNEVLLIAMTGYGEEHHQRASREAGFGHHLVKPVDPNTLLEMLARLIPRGDAAAV